MAVQQAKHDVELIRQDDAAFQQACANTSLRSLRVHICKVKDWTPLSGLKRLERLTIVDFRGGRLEMLSPLVRLKQLSLSHFPKEHDLSPLESLKNVEALDLRVIASWFFNRKFMRWHSLVPISRLKNLRSLTFDMVRIDKGGLYPLANLQRLEEFSCCNNYSIEEFAYLSAKLPKAKGPPLEPYSKSMGHKCKKCGTVMMLLAGAHARAKVACPICDTKQLAEHAEGFNRLKEQFRAESKTVRSGK